MDNARKPARAPRPAGANKIALLIAAAVLGSSAIAAQAATTARAGERRAARACGCRSQGHRWAQPHERLPPHAHGRFQITLSTQRDDVDSYGQLITLSGGGLYKVRRPDAFPIDLNLPGQSGRYVYDGKTVTAYDAPTNAYARYPAPATIRATLDPRRAEVWGDGAAGRPLQVERGRQSGEVPDLGALHRQVANRRPDHEPLRLPPARTRLADLDRRRRRAAADARHHHVATDDPSNT